MSGFPFTKQYGRHQVLVDAAHLVPLGSPWQVSEVWFRRDMTNLAKGQPSTMLGGAVDLEVSAGAASSLARDPSDLFQSNRGPAHRVVFRGTVTLPDVGPAPSVPAPWTAPYAVKIPFDAPISGVSTQDLLLEFVVTRTPGQPEPKWWIVDRERFSAPGVAVAFGGSCSTRFPYTRASADSESLRPGSSLVFSLWSAAPSALCMHVVGISDQDFLGAPILPLALDAYGAPGCTLYTDMTLVSAHLTEPRPPKDTGGALTSLHVPSDPALVGATLFSQWIVSEPGANALGVSTTNGVKLQLSLTDPSGGVTFVKSYDLASPTGVIQKHLCPVMRFVR